MNTEIMQTSSEYLIKHVEFSANYDAPEFRPLLPTSPILVINRISSLPIINPVSLVRDKMKKKVRINRRGEIHRYCRYPTVGRFLVGDRWRARPTESGEIFVVRHPNLAACQGNRSDIV